MKRSNLKILKLILIKLDSEAYIWTFGLITLAFLDFGDHHLTICPIANLGYEWCLGCGLGRAIALIFKGQFMESFEMHPLGLLAIIVLIYRIATLFTITWKLKITEYEQDA